MELNVIQVNLNRYLKGGTMNSLSLRLHYNINTRYHNSLRKNVEQGGFLGVKGDICKKLLELE